MNPTDWQYTHQRQRESLDPRQMTDSKEKIIYPYCGYSVKDRRLHAEMEHHNPSSHRSYRLNSNHFTPEKATDPDGEPVEPSNIDGELARKRRELQQIVKQISLKKATIAMKTTEPFFKAKTPCQMFKEEKEEALSLSKVDNSVKNTQPFMSTRGKDVGFSRSKWSSTYNNRPLKERVNVMLQRRYPDRFRAKAFSTPYDHLPSPNPGEKINMSTLNKDDHPLKLRVKALMNRRRNSGVLDSHGEVPVVKPHPPSQSPSTTVVGNDLVFKGFQRFLNILNEVVDIEALTKIVNGDKELPLTGQELLHSQPPVVKEKSDVCKSESQRLQRAAGQRDRRSCSKERKTELLNQDISHGGGKRNIQPEEKSAPSDDRGGTHFGSSRRSRSPPVVEEKKPKLEQHQEELQNILKTIGFSLEADDMCKLAERTQERLYGRKHETKQSLASTGVSKRSQQHVQSDHSRSSSSTSVSVSPSSRPSHHQHSYSETFRDSREQARDGNSDNNRIDPYPEDPEYHVPYPDAASAVQTYNSDVASAIPTHFGPYTLVQHSEYTASAYHSYYSSGASSIAWNYGSNVVPPSSSSYPPGFCNSVNHLCPPANTGALPGQVYPHPHLPAGHKNVLGHSCFNADLSLSEGQSGQRSGPHYLHVINTGKSNGTGGSMAQVNMKLKARPSKRKRWKKRSGITTNTLLPEPPVGAGTGQQKKTATRVINTQTSSGTAFCLTQLNKKSSKSARRAKRRREREHYITKKLAQPITDVQVQSIEKKIEEQKERELITVAVGCSSANSQKDPAQMQTRQLRSGIKYPTNTLHSEPPVEASTEVQQKKTATHVINTQTSSGTACCLTDMKVAKTESVKYNLAEYKNAAQKLFQEMKKLKSTASWTARYIRLAKSNHAEYSESKQRNTLKWLLKKQRRTEELREENKRELDMILLYSYPPDKSSTEAQQLEGDLPTEEISSKENFAAFKKEMAEMTLALADCSSIIDEKDPAQMGKSDFPSGITTNNLNPELPGEDTSEAGQMERELPTEEQMKANLKEKLAAFNQKMKQHQQKLSLM